MSNSNTARNRITLDGPRLMRSKVYQAPLGSTRSTTPAESAGAVDQVPPGGTRSTTPVESAGMVDQVPPGGTRSTTPAGQGG